MNLSLFLLALRARLGLFATIFIATVAAAAAISMTMEKTWRATASLLVDVKEEQSLSDAMRPLMMRQEMVSYLQTQMDIIKSDKVARKVVQDLGLAQDARLVEKFRETNTGKPGTVEDWLVEALHQGLEVETSQSSVVRITYTASDPAMSAAVANAFANAYIATVLELRVDPAREAVAWFDVQLKSLRSNLEEAQAKLTDYHRRHGIVSADERDDVETTRLGALAGQLSASQEQRAQWEAKERQVQEAIDQGGSAERMPEVFNHPIVLRLKEDLMRGEAKLQTLSTQFGVNHPTYQSQASENAGLRQKLDAEITKLVSGIRSSARQSRQREEEVRRAMAEQRSKLLDLKGDRNELTVLRRNAETAEHAYDAAMQRFVVSQVDSRANQTNITMLNPADVPRKHFRPRILQNIALAAVVGILLGVALVLLVEMFDRRVRARSDLELGVPMLGVINAWQSGGTRSLEGRRLRALPGIRREAKA